MNYTEMVREFYIRNGLVVPEAEILRLDPLRMRKRIRLMAEEMGELICAMDERNVVEVADACGDLAYVIAGTSAALGLPHHVAYPQTFEKFKLGYVRNSSDSIKLTDSMLGNYACSLIAGLNHLTEVLRFGGNTHTAFMPFMKVVYSVAVAFDLPLDECVAEVHASNMTKTKLNEHSKGGKGEGYRPPDMARVINAAKLRKGSVESIG